MIWPRLIAANDGKDVADFELRRVQYEFWLLEHILEDEQDYSQEHALPFRWLPNQMFRRKCGK